MKIRSLICALVSVLIFTGALAEPFVEIAGGQTSFRQFKSDGGRFYQEAFPWSADMKSPAGRIGIGNKINDRWDYTVSWMVIGNNSVDAQFVPDADYDPSTHTCLANCDKPMQVRAYGDGRGPEVAFRYNFEHVYLRSGLFLWLTQLHVTQLNPEGDTLQKYQWHTAQHWMLTPFLGGGLRHQFKGGEVFVEVSYYKVVDSTGGYPLATSAVVPMVGARARF